MNIPPALLGFIRGVAMVVIIAVLSFVGDASHLTFLNPLTASLIASIALAIEHSLGAKNGTALFGAVRTA